MSYLLAVVMIIIICAAQWFFTSRALRSPSHFIGWVSGGYAAKIGLLALGFTFRAPSVSTFALLQLQRSWRSSCPRALRWWS